METQGLTQILMILLIIASVILFFMISLFLILWAKKNKKQEEDNKKNKITVDSEQENGLQKLKQTKVYTTQDIKQFMNFDSIKDNMIIQKNGKKILMVIQCQGINYDLMSSIEKVGVEQGFVQFLNTLTRPIQIYVQTRKVNLEQSLENYKKKLKIIEASYNKAKLQYDNAQKNRNIDIEQLKRIKMEYVRQKNLYEYTKDIINNTESMSLNKNILTKKYYIAISYYPENSEGLFKKEEIIDLAFSELYTNAQAIIRTLSICDVTAKILDSEELADLLYVAYNRDASEIFGVDKAIKAGYDSLYVTSQDVLNKKIEELDKIINERALKLANETIDSVSLNSQRKKEAEMKEKDLEQIIRSMAKSLIEENRGYIPEDIVKESVEKIDKMESSEVNETKKTTKSRKKKGA